MLQSLRSQRVGHVLVTEQQESAKWWLLNQPESMSG